MELNEIVYVRRPVAAVFEAWSHIERAGRHSPAVVERTKLTEGPVARARASARWTAGRDGW